jgi:hypothetical protein
LRPVFHLQPIDEVVDRRPIGTRLIPSLKLRRS